MTQGIDMDRSGWENPEGFERAPRPRVDVPVVRVCEAPGPDGWTCDLKPNHQPTDQHYADDGGRGVRWTGPMADVSRIQDEAPVLIPAYAHPGPPKPATLPDGLIVPDAPDRFGKLAQVESVATQALDTPSPAAWAVALDKIVGICRG